MGLIKKKLLDFLTGRFVHEGYPTDLLLASSTGSAFSGDSNIATITVPAGSQLVVFEVDVFSSSSASVFELTYTQTVLGVPVSQSKYYELDSASNILDKGSMDQPVLSMQNLTTASVSVYLKVLGAASGSKYTGNVAYVLRAPLPV